MISLQVHVFFVPEHNITYTMKITSGIIALMAMAASAVALPEVATMPEALAAAKEKNCNIFVDFTGTDWCTACIQLRNKIVNSPEFEAEFGDKFVLVPVDFPRTPALLAKVSREEMKAREAMLYSYKIEGLPGVVLMDAAGLPFEVIHGTRRTPADYIPLVQAGLERLAARNAALAAAEGKTGMERAGALASALQTVPEVCRDKYTDVIAEINSLDPENTLGYRGYANSSVLRISQQAALREVLDSFRGKVTPAELLASIAELDSFLAQPDLVPEVRQDALRAKGDTYAMLRDMNNMVKAYKEAYDVAPRTRTGQTLERNLKYYENLMKQQ